MKKIKLNQATEEQIAKNIEMFPEKWGITFPTSTAYDKKVTVEKAGDDLKVEIEGVMSLRECNYPYSYTKDEYACATLTVKLQNINWDEEIWTEVQGEFVEDIVAQVEGLNVEITETPVFVECYRDMVLERNQEVEEMLKKKWIGEVIESQYTTEDLITFGGKLRTDISCQEVVEESETESPNWQWDEYESNNEIWSNVKFFIKVSKKDGEYSIEVVD